MSPPDTSLLPPENQPADAAGQSGTGADPAEEDATLLTRFRAARCQRSFAVLVERHIAAVHAACRECLGPAHPWLDDGTQAVFLILARRGAEIRDARALPAWLRTTARGVCANIRRTERRRREREREAGVADAEPPPDLQEGLARAELRSRLEQAIAALTEAQREAVVRHFLQDKRQAEVAAELGVSEGAVKKRIADAMVTLRTVFQGAETSLPSVLALGLGGEHALSPRLLEHCIATGAGGGSARAHAVAALRAPRPWLAATGAGVLAAGLCAWLAWGALGPRPAPAPAPRHTAAWVAAVPPVVAPDPAAEAILGPIHAIRRNDLHALLACLPASQQARVAQAWSGFAASSAPLSDALADWGLGLVRKPSAVDDFLPYYRPLTTDLLTELHAMAATAQGHGLAAEARLFSDLTGDLQAYLATIDVHAPALARAVVEASVATGRQWPFRTVAEARQFSFAQALDCLDGTLATIKRWWLPYGLDVDRVLDSVVVERISGSGSERTAHVRFTACGRDYRLALGIRSTGALWECPQLEATMDQTLGEVSHYFYLPPATWAPQPAAPTRGDPADPAPLAAPVEADPHAPRDPG